ncbi:MAG TPA: hypothetical protein PKY87_16060 [Terricaulis sp.]|nr:hypothetical protein [Terricaulis sp.]
MPSPRFIRAITAQETSDAPATLITLTHPSFPAPIRLTDCGRDLVSSAAALLIGMETEATFTARAMQPPVLPGDAAEVTQRRANLVIDNTERDVLAIMSLANSEISARLDLVLAATPDVLEESWPGLRVTEFSPAGGMLAITLAPREDSSETWPFQTFAPSRTPALFS